MNGIDIVNELNLLAAANPAIRELIGDLLAHRLKLNVDEETLQALADHPSLALIQDETGIYYSWLSILNGISDRTIAMRHNEDGSFGGFMVVANG